MDPVDTLLEFLEVATHLILYRRGVYPPELFEERRKYGAPVYISRHPALRDYVSQVVLSLRNWMRSGLIEKFHILLKDIDDVVQERFVFEIAIQPSAFIAQTASELPAALRAFLLKINVSESQLIPSKCVAFRIVVDMAPGVESETLDWVRAEEPEQLKEHSISHHVTLSSMAQKSVIPLKSSAPYDVPGFRMQVWVEQLAPTRIFPVT